MPEGFSAVSIPKFFTDSKSGLGCIPGLAFKKLKAKNHFFEDFKVLILLIYVQKSGRRTQKIENLRPEMSSTDKIVLKTCITTYFFHGLGCKIQTFDRGTNVDKNASEVILQTTISPKGQF